jgi:hypothetical protein
MDKAGWHEFLVYALNRPLAFAITHLAARLGPAAHLPPIGTFVNDAEIAREVLTDTAHFDSHSPGSLGVLLTQALGSYASVSIGNPQIISIHAPKSVSNRRAVDRRGRRDNV